MPGDAPGDATPQPTVLLVDDERMVLDVGKAILQRLGHEVITATSGEEALSLFDRHHGQIACVVLDLTMPGMDGTTTYARLRSKRPDLPVVIASGMSADQVSSQFDDQVNTTIIQKPYQVADLSAKIRALMRTAGGA